MIRELPRGIGFIRETQAVARQLHLNDLAPNECPQFFLALTLFQIGAKDYYKDFGFLGSLLDDSYCVRTSNGFYFISSINYSTEEDERLAEIKKNDPEYYKELQEIFSETSEMATGLTDEQIDILDKETLEWRETVEEFLKTPCIFQYKKIDCDSEAVIFAWKQESYRKNSKWIFVKDE